MQNSMDMVKGKTEGTWDFKHKTELKHTCGEKRFSTKVTASNKDFQVEVQGRPKNLNTDKEVEFKVEAKVVPQSENWDAKLEAKLGGIEVGPIKPWTEVEFKTNKAKQHQFIMA
jgi:hypothetical protein